jgi:DNA-binding response OmpR family regulator
MENKLTLNQRIYLVSKDIVYFNLQKKILDKFNWELILMEDIYDLSQIDETYPPIAAIIIDGELLTTDHLIILNKLKQLHSETILFLMDHFSTQALSKALQFGFDEFVAKPNNILQMKLLFEKKLFHIND